MAVPYEYYPFLDVIIGSRRCQHKVIFRALCGDWHSVFRLGFHQFNETHVIKQKILVEAQHAVEITPEGREVETTLILRRHFKSEYSGGIFGA